MSFEAGKVTIGKNAQVGRVNAGIGVHGLDPEQAAATIRQLASWRITGGDVVVHGTAGDVNAGVDVTFTAPAGPEAIEALRADLAAIREELAELAAGDALPSEARDGVAAAAADVGDAADEAAKAKPLSGKIQGRIKGASETLEQLSKSADAGEKLVERGKAAWPIVRAALAKLALLAQMARHIPWPG